MDKRTLKALHGSIRKWIKIATWEGEDQGADNCPLCKEFLKKSSCIMCPVSLKVHKTLCYGSPYIEWQEVSEMDDGGFCNRVFDAASQKASEKMTLFLIALLPEEEKSRYYEEE